MARPEGLPQKRGDKNSFENINKPQKAKTSSGESLPSSPLISLTPDINAAEVEQFKNPLTAATNTSIFRPVEITAPAAQPAPVQASSVDSLVRQTQLNAEVEGIREAVQRSLTFELPVQVEPVSPRSTDIKVLQNPRLLSDERQEEIAVMWRQRLDKLRFFQTRLAGMPRWQQIVERFVRRKAALIKDLFDPGDPRGDIFVRVAAYLSDEEMRGVLLANIDLVTKQETEQLVAQAKRNGGYLTGFPLLVGGTGWHGASSAIELQAFANGPVLAIDMGERRGGLFRTFTPQSGPDIPAFATNSRDNRRHVFGKRSLAGGTQNLNPFSDNAAVQTVAFDRSSYPGNHIFAAAVAVNSYVAGAALQGAELMMVAKNGRATGREDELLATVDYKGESIIIPFFGGALAFGSGDFFIPNLNNDKETAQIIDRSKAALRAYLAGTSNTLPQAVTGQEFLQMAVARKGDFFRALIGKRLALAGKKDTAQIVIAALAGDVPDPRLYGDYVTQEGGPEEVLWIGPEKRTRETLPDELKLRPRYARNVIPDYPRTDNDRNALLKPTFQTRAKSLRSERNGTLTVETTGGQTRRKGSLADVDLFISCTGVFNDQAAKVFSGITRFSPLRTVSDIDKNQLYKEVPGYEDRLLVVGPGAGLQVSGDEKLDAPALRRVGENVVAIWLNTEKVALASRALARRFNGKEIPPPPPKPLSRIVFREVKS